MFSSPLIPSAFLARPKGLGGCSDLGTVPAVVSGPCSSRYRGVGENGEHDAAQAHCSAVQHVGVSSRPSASSSHTLWKKKWFLGLVQHRMRNIKTVVQNLTLHLAVCLLCLVMSIESITWSRFFTDLCLWKEFTALLLRMESQVCQWLKNRMKKFSLSSWICCELIQRHSGQYSNKTRCVVCVG